MRTEDGSIIQECLNGDPSAFGMLVDKYKAGIYAFVYDKLRDFRDAQDVTQEVFEKAYRNLRSLRHWESFTFWLYRIARNLCRNWIRSQSRRPDQEFIEDQDPAMLEDLSLNSYRENQAYESLREALDSLPDAYREVLLLHYFGGMNIKDMARSLGASPTAIGMRLSRARAQLREEIIAMMDTAFEGNKLPASFTFHIVEIIKRIKIQPVPPKPLPWGLALATGLIVAVLSIGIHINVTSTADYGSISSSGESKVLDVGEFPVDVMKVSNETVISTQQLSGDSVGNLAPNLQNALFMNPQAEGGTWASKADMPTRRGWLSTSAVGGKIYAIGGIGVGFLTNVEEYDPDTDTWTRKANMPTQRGALSTSVVNGKIYAIGGCVGANPTIPLSTVEEYDPETDKWTKKADMPTARSLNLSTCEVNGKIYAIGGYNHTLKKELSLLEEYDAETDTWTKKADMPTARYGLCASAVDGKIYAIGGISNIANAVLSVVEEYDPVRDTWERKADMPTARYIFATSVVNGRIYAIGGWNGGKGGTLSIVEEYNPLTDTWTEKTDMTTARDALSTSVVNGKIYAIGGNATFDFVNVIATVEEYNPGASESINFKGKLPTTWGDVRTAMKK